MSTQNIQQIGFNRTPPTSAAVSALDFPQPPDAPYKYSFRLPKPGTVDQFFGGTRSFWSRLVLPTEANEFKPPVKSIVMRKPGSRRTIRFILYESARTFFENLESEQTGAEAGTSKEAA